MLSNKCLQKYFHFGIIVLQFTREVELMIKILPSIASADPLHLSDEIERVRAVGRLHLDIEDGNFINNITFGEKTIRAISGIYSGELDAHLMTTEPLAWLPLLKDAGVRAVCAHIEALPYPKLFLRRAKSHGMRTGLAANLKVPLAEFEAYADELDYVLVMTSEPDDGAQEFFPGAVKRVAALRSMLPPGVEIWCDGGIKPEFLPELSAAGMNAAVMGRAIFGVPDPLAAVHKYERSIK